MFKINLVCVEGVKEKFYAQACEEYLKRLSRFCRVTVTEIPGRAFSGEPGEREREALLLEEYGRYKNHLKGRVVVLDIEGKSLSSEEFSTYLLGRKDEGAELTFLIGGSHGLHGEVKRAADLRLSFSQMTFPHTLFRVMLLEQIYRAFMIGGGGSYHK